MTGAEITLSSSTIAKRWLTLARLTSAKRRAPIELKVKLTTHSPVSGLVPARASVRSAPSTSIRLRTAIFSFGRSCIGRYSSPGGGGPPAAGLAVSSTSRNVMCAVLPINCLMRSGSPTPGSCTTMRSCPWRVICGSTTPVSSMRRRTISIDWSTAPAARAASAGADRVRVIGAVRLRPIVMSGRPVEASWLISGFSAATAASVLAGVAQPQQDPILVWLWLQRLVEDLAAAQRLPDPIGQAVQPLLHHRLHVDLEQQIAAAAQVEAEVNRAPGHPRGRGGKQIGHAEQYPEQADAQDERGLHAAEIHHGLTRGAPGHRVARLAAVLCAAAACDCPVHGGSRAGVAPFVTAAGAVYSP